MTRTTTSMPDPASEPFCSNCGYQLTGLTDSSKCPECGRPLVEVLTRPGQLPNNGIRYRSKATLFGLPVIDVALGPKNGKMHGVAKGIFAVGDLAFGGVAIGGVSFGAVALGGVGVGLCTAGGLSIGLLTAMGGLAVGGIAVGGGAVGVLATGGGAAGFVAQGGGAAGAYARDSRTPWNAPTPPVFEQLWWFFGSWPPAAGGMFQPVLVTAGAMLILALLIGSMALIRFLQEPGMQPER